MTTTHRTLVNGCNAAQSTGPRTLAGKSRSVRNSWKHGLTASRPTLTGENRSEWLRLLHGITESINPQNLLEQQYAEDLAYQQWKRIRLREYETARNQEIVNRVNHARGQHDQISELRADCKRFKSLCKEWKEIQVFVQRILNKRPKDKVTSGEVNCLFQAFVDLLDHKELFGQKLNDRLLVSAGYRLPDDAETVFDDVDLLHGLPWTRGMLNPGLKYIAKTAGIPVKRLLDSLDSKITERIKSYTRDYRDSKKELAELERDALRMNSDAILKEMYADCSENRTIQRLESHTAKQLQQAIHRIASLRGLNLEAAEQGNVSVGIAISSAVHVPTCHQAGNTTTEIDDVTQLECADERMFEASNLADNLRKEPTKVLS